MRIGADYYPEQWEEKRWETDARMMKEAGIEVIRIAEFAWSLMEPEEGCYDFSLFDRVIELFSKYNIHIVLGTPTAAPPKWLVDKYPSVLQEDKQGHTRVFGSRRHYCFNSEIYRKKSAEIVRKMAQHYAKNPNIEAWQIDNEFGCQDTTHCYCDDCEAAFHRWLEKKYKTIDNLNKKWGTVFWSQVYIFFDEIIPPRASTCEGSCQDTKGQNPSLMLDYKRFSSDSVIEFQQKQIDIIKEYTNVPVTTNFMGYFSEIDYYKLAENLDFVSWDNYLDTQWGCAYPVNGSFGHTMMRSLKKAPIWVMEQQSGPCGWGKMGGNPEPGKLRLWTWQAIANGADTVVYFRWRAALCGTEQYWYGILNQDGRINRRYEEIARTAKEIQEFTKKHSGIEFKPETAIVQSYDSIWSHGIHPHVEGFSADNMQMSLYDELFNKGIGTEFVSPEETLKNYRVVFAPALNVADQAVHDHLMEYVKEGGSLVLTYRSGIRTENNTMYPLPAPGIFADLVGATAEDFDPQAGRSVSVTGVFGDTKAHIWCDVMKTDSADTLGIYAGQYYRGKPAVTVNKVGKGTVYYLGCDLEREALRNFLEYVLKKAEVSNPFTKVLPDVEIAEAQDDGSKIWFVLNHHSGVRIMELKERYKDVLSGQTFEHVITLQPYDVAILEKC